MKWGLAIIAYPLMRVPSSRGRIQEHPLASAYELPCPPTTQRLLPMYQLLRSPINILFALALLMSAQIRRAMLLH